MDKYAGRSIAKTVGLVCLCATLGATSETPATSFEILGGIKMTVAVSGAQTGGSSATIVAEFPPGAGPPAHIHTREDETYVVTRGHFRFWHGSHVIDAPEGTVVFMPRNEPHQFVNVGNTLGEQVLTIAPAGLEKMFVAMAKAGLTVPKDLPEIVRLGTEYGITYVAPLAPLPGT